MKKALKSDAVFDFAGRPEPWRSHLLPPVQCRAFRSQVSQDDFSSLARPAALNKPRRMRRYLQDEFFFCGLGVW